MHYRASAGTRDKGGKPARDTAQVWFGASIASRGDRAIVTAVGNGSPAELAGISPGDELVALDSLRVNAASLDTAVRRYRINDKVEVAVFRGDELLTLELKFMAAPENTVHLALAADASDEALSRRRRLLGK